MHAHTHAHQQCMRHQCDIKQTVALFPLTMVLMLPAFYTRRVLIKVAMLEGIKCVCMSMGLCVQKWFSV